MPFVAALAFWQYWMAAAEAPQRCWKLSQMCHVAPSISGAGVSWGARVLEEKEKRKGGMGGRKAYSVLRG